MPALILMGADDPIVPMVNGRIIADRLPDARLEIVDCGHLFILTDPAGTAARIERFLPAIATARPSATRLPPAEPHHNRHQRIEPWLHMPLPLTTSPSCSGRSSISIAAWPSFPATKR